VDVLSRSRRRSNRDGAKPGSSFLLFFCFVGLDQVGCDLALTVPKEMNDLADHHEFVKSSARGWMCSEVIEVDLPLSKATGVQLLPNSQSCRETSRHLGVPLANNRT
jgi:hypothetical protein